MRRRNRSVTVAVAAVVALAAPLFASVACSQSDDHHAHDPIPSDPCSDGGAHVRVGVTDEACRAFADAEARGQIVTDGTRAPAWSTPAAGPVAASPPPTFSWTKGAIAVSPLRRLLRALDPIGTAWAHGDTTGDAYVLQLRDAAGGELLRVLTTGLEWTPDQATWDRVRAGGSVRVVLVGVRFVRNEVAPGTSPVAAPPFEVTVP